MYRIPIIKRKYINSSHVSLLRPEFTVINMNTALKLYLQKMHFFVIIIIQKQKL